MQSTIVADIAILMSLSLAGLILMRLLRLPSILGFLIAGIVAGPHGTHIIADIHAIELLAEIGVVLLLFTIGLEFSFKQFAQNKRQVFGAGSLQFLTAAALAAVCYAPVAASLAESALVGIIAAFSSTALVFKILQDRAEASAPHGRIAVGVSIFQDILVLPMMVLVPLFAGQSSSFGQDLGMSNTILIGGLILAAGYLGFRFLPGLLDRTVRLRSNEIFLLAVIVLCFFAAWMASLIGLSLALGAFIAGMLIANSDYGEHALAQVLPFKDVFLGFFFVSVGMLLDIGFLGDYPLHVLGATVGIIVLKTAAGTSAVLILGYPWRVALLTGTLLGQVGEFSFIILRQTAELNMLPPFAYQLLLTSTVVTMALTPLLFPAVSHYMASYLNRSSGKHRPPGDRDEAESENPQLLIIGYGVIGRQLGKAAKLFGVPYSILEMNPETVRRYRRQGEPILFGDATHVQALTRAGLRNIRSAVVSVPDPASARRIVDLLRRERSDILIITRTRYSTEIESLKKLGADEVVSEEVETAVRIFKRIMTSFLVSRETIKEHIAHIRSNKYGPLGSTGVNSAAVTDDMQGSATVGSLRVNSESPVVRKTVSAEDLHREFNISLMAIQRGDALVMNISGETLIHEDDILIVFGKKEDIASYSRYLENEQQ